MEQLGEIRFRIVVFDDKFLRVLLLPRFRFDGETERKRNFPETNRSFRLTKRSLLISRAKKQVEGRFRVTEKKSFV